jgi:hypothetical protein
MSIEHDLHCVKCGVVVHHVAVDYGHYPDCVQCGGKMAVNWEHKQPPSTDVFGCAQYSDASGEWHTSTRDKVKSMAEWGYHEAGDPVGGARIVHRLEGTGFSFPGQASRRTVSEGA